MKALPPITLIVAIKSLTYSMIVNVRKPLENNELKIINLPIRVRDPLADFLFNSPSLKILAKPLNFALISVLSMSSFYIVAAFISNTFHSPQPEQIEPLGLFQDCISWLWIIILNPIVMGYYCWLSKQNIATDLLITINKINLEESSTHSKNNEFKSINCQYLYLIALFFAQIYGVIFYKSKAFLPSHWASIQSLPLWATTIIGVLVAYMVIMEGIILIINSQAIIKIISNKKLQINPFYSDRCGGLKLIGDYITRINTLLSIIFIMLTSSMLQFSNSKEIHNNGADKVGSLISIPMLILIYVFGYCICCTLYSVHKKMEMSKNNFFAPFAKEKFEKRHNLSLFESSSGYYTVVDNFPVWPFDTKLIQTWMSILIPITIAIITNISAIMLRALEYSGPEKSLDIPRLEYIANILNIADIPKLCELLKSVV